MTNDPPPRSTVEPQTWVDAYSDLLYAYALKKLRDPEAAEEAVQETFVAALKNAAQFRNEGQEGAWLMGILKRKVIDTFRRHAKQAINLTANDPTLDQLFDDRGHWRKTPSQSELFKLDTLEREEFREIFQKCVEHLPATQASAFVMREVEQKSSDEVCDTLAITPSNFWVLMHRARLRLAACIRNRWQMGDH